MAPACNRAMREPDQFFIVSVVEHDAAWQICLRPLAEAASARMELAEFAVIRDDYSPGIRLGLVDGSGASWRPSWRLPSTHWRWNRHAIYLRLCGIPALAALASYSVIIPLVIVS